MPEGNARFEQVVRGHFDIHFISNADTNKVLAHFTGDMGEDLVAVGQSDAEHSARQDLGHRAHQFNWFFLRHLLS